MNDCLPFMIAVALCPFILTATRIRREHGAKTPRDLTTTGKTAPQMNPCSPAESEGLKRILEGGEKK